MSTASPKSPWWAHRRAKRAIAGLIAAGIAGLAVWLILFRPFIATDDARVNATLIRIAPEGVGGKVIALNAVEGDHVTQGQVLAELDHGIPQANLTKAKARATQAEKELHRLEQLAAQQGVPPRDVDNARAGSQMAAAELELAQIAFDRTYIKSPIEGVVVQRVAEVGNILEQNQTAFTVADIDHAWVAANIEETAIADVKLGQAVSINIDEGGSLNGKISEIRGATASTFALIQAENPSGNFTKLVQRIPIKIALEPHADRRLRAGQSVEIKIRVR